MSDGKELNNDEQQEMEPQAQAGEGENAGGEDMAAQGAAVEGEQSREPQRQEESSPADEDSLAAMRLVEVDGSEGIRDAKRALGELEALLDDFEKPAQSGADPSVTKSEHVRQSEVDSRLEEVAAAVTAATAGSRRSGSHTATASGAGKGGLLPGILGGVALLLGIVAMIHSSGVGDRVEALEQAKASIAPSAGKSEEPARLRAEFRHLSERVNELAVALTKEGPTAESAAGIAEIEARLAQLEQQLGTEPVAGSAPEGDGEVAAPPPLGGHWVINLTSFSSETVADQEVERLHALGIPVEKQRAVSGGKVWYRLRITGLATYEKAKAYIAELGKRIDIDSAWIASE